MDKVLLERLSGLCDARGVRFTPQRKQVFELICANEGASSAYDLLEQLKETEPHAKPPTIYRALDFLLEQGFIHKVESNNSFISCCSCGENRHYSQLLVCDKCGNVVELQDDKLIDVLARNSEEYDFQITNHVIETHGICKACRSNMKS